MVVAGGDLRKAITYLQYAHRMCSSSLITPEEVDLIAGIVPAETISDFFKVSQESFTAQRQLVQSMIRSGYPAMQILSQVSIDLMEIDF